MTLALCGSLWVLPAGAATAPTASRPNVLVIISDDHGWGDYGFMGHAHLQTPHLDRLARESLTFTRGYTPVPLCRPSLASIITGLPPHQHGVTGNDPALPDPTLNAMTQRTNPAYARYYETIIGNFAARPNLVRALTAQGYRAFQTGKWWEGDPIKTGGFTHAMTRGEGRGGRHGDAGLAIGRQGLQPIYDFLTQAGNQPWLVWYAPFLPHDPHTPPADLLEKYRALAPTEAVARYWGNVEWFDRTVGELLDWLELRGQRDNTIVLYTADNGYIQHPDLANRCAPRSKNTPCEGGVRTPIMVSWPGRVQPRLDTEHLASNVDLWPTLAALLHQPVPPGLPGINLTDSRAVARRRRIFGEQYAHDIADVAQPTCSLQSRWVIDGWWKLIVPEPGISPDASPALYQLREDPWETNSLASAEPRRVRQLTRHLDAGWNGTAKP